MNLHFVALDRLASSNRLVKALCFKAPLDVDCKDTFVLVIWFKDRKGDIDWGVVRTHNTNTVRTFKTLRSVEKLIVRWKLDGMYVSILESSALANKDAYLTDDEWEFVKDRALLPNLEVA